MVSLEAAQYPDRWLFSRPIPPATAVPAITLELASSIHRPGFVSSNLDVNTVRARLRGFRQADRQDPVLEVGFYPGRWTSIAGHTCSSLKLQPYEQPRSART